MGAVGPKMAVQVRSASPRALLFAHFEGDRHPLESVIGMEWNPRSEAPESAAGFRLLWHPPDVALRGTNRWAAKHPP